MNTSVPLIIFLRSLLSLLFTGVVEAQTNSGNVSFSGAVVVPTCSMARPQVIADVHDVPQASSDMVGTASACLEGSDAKHPVVVSFVSTIRTLGNTESDSLLDYFVRRSKSPSGDDRVSNKLVTLTYQ